MGGSNFGQNGQNGQNGQGFYQAFPSQGQANPQYTQLFGQYFYSPMSPPTQAILPSQSDILSEQGPLSDYGGTHEASDSVYGASNGMNPWQGIAPSIYGAASSMGDLASRIGHVGISTQPQTPNRKKRRRLTPSAAAVPRSTAGFDVADDRRSIGAAAATEALSEQGDIDLESYAMDLGNSSFRCLQCHVEKHPRCEMVKHIKTHTKPYKCSRADCKQGFATKSDLERHMKTHDIGNLAVAYYCSHDKCRTREKPWPRWDNFKTHLRDVHTIHDPRKEDYRKKSDAAQSNILAGIGAASVPVDPISALVPGVDDLNSDDILGLGDANMQLAFPDRLGDGMQAIDRANEAFREHAHKSMQADTTLLMGAETMGSMSSISPFNPSLAMDMYPLTFQSTSAYDTNMSALPGPSEPAAFVTQPGTNLAFTLGMSLPTPSYQHPPQTLPRTAGARSSLPTTQSMQSTNSCSGGIAPSFIRNSSSIASHVVPSQRPRSESQTTWRTIDTPHTMANGTADMVMDDAVVENHSVRSGASAAVRASVCSGSFQPGGMASGALNAIAGDVGAPAEPEAGGSALRGVGHDAGDMDLGDDDGSQNHRVSDQRSAVPYVPTVTVDDDDTAADAADADDDGEDITPEEPSHTAAEPAEPAEPMQYHEPAPASDVDEVVRRIKTYTGEQLGVVIESICSMETFHNLGLELRTAAQPSASAHSVNSAPTGASDDGSGSKKHHCKFPGCKASFTSISTWKKHDTRHRRPFACTHGCLVSERPQTFGSKNDWKRHEEPSHFAANLRGMTWLCDATCAGTADTVCEQRFTSRDTFEKHLEDEHAADMAGLANNKARVERVAKCRQIPAHAATFWCGFCKTMMDEKATPVPADAANTANTPVAYARLLSARFNHIDNHFMGRNCTQVGIEDWAPPPPKPPAAARTHRDAGDKRLSSHSARTCRTHGAVFTEGCASCKKPKPITRTRYWSCCGCMGTSVSTDTNCIHCNKRFCGDCTIGTHY